MKKRILSTLMALCIAGSTGSALMNMSMPVEAANNNVIYIPKNYYLNVPTKEQIIEKYNELLFDVGQNISYERDYSFKNPFVPGEIGKSDKLNALNILNFCRYIVGLPDDIKLNDEYSWDAQAVAYLNAFNGNTAYYNEQKDNFPNMLYQTAEVARQKVVIGSDCDNIADAVLSCWTRDLYDKNIQGAGYKFMALSTQMQEIGFGQVDNQYAVYTYDRSRKDHFADDYVMWPAEDMPYELFKNGAFALQLGDGYGRPKVEGVTVDIKSEKTGEHWHFTGANVPENCHMSVHQDSYDECPCLIFGVNSKFACDDKVMVKITGLSKNGRSVTVNRTVNFFSLSNVTLNAESVTLGAGEEYQLEYDIFTADTRNNNSIAYISDNEEVAVVSEDGLVTALKAGTANIMAQLPNGAYAECKFTVKKPPETVEFTKSITSLFTGETANISSLVKTSKGSASLYNTYTSDNKKVCTVDDEGNITGVGAGVTMVNVTTYNGVSAKIQVFVSKLSDIENRSKISAKEILLDDSVTVSAKAAGGAGSFTYEVAYKKLGDENWTTAQKYSKNTSVSITPKVATDYEVKVSAKDRLGNVNEQTFALSVKLPFANITTVKESIAFGESLVINASGQGGTGEYQYAVQYKKASSSAWTTVQNFSENSEIKLTPKAMTEYDICVKVKDSDGTVDKKFYKLAVMESLSNISEMSAEEIKFGESVTTYNKAVGGTAPYAYAVYYKKAGTTKWTTVQNFKDSTETVINPKAVVKYNVCVKVKDDSGNIAKKYMVLNVIK